MRGRLDSIDWAILKELQADGSITNVELARRVGLSAPPCLRRVRALESAGIIKAYRAMLDPKALGFEIVCFAMVQLDVQGKKELTEFERHIKDWSMVRECWTLSGDIDFILKCVAPNLAAFQNFVSDLTSLTNVRNVRTALSLDLIKDEPLVPIEDASDAN
ncbi:Lrp/AsnC family transcriptional regulator [Microvirga alba]|uniref:Lrp/AsnC family transcriptional regulator n=1 Tax=Microvirga alba TaxID=2791025 RepID=A0A931BRD7_9HYPH|nr:Lrp/AsnC family transcriptional regulator [Microvirga alba]MBF9234294.1 Lrp/AsnC family transcriptional regulator [Microvirga alba]